MKTFRGVRTLWLVAAAIGGVALSLAAVASAENQHPKPAPQTLWVSSSGWIDGVGFIAFFSELNPVMIKRSGIPKVIMNAGNPQAFGSAGGVAFDSEKQLWVPFSGGNSVPYGAILRFTRKNIAQLAHRHRTVVLAIYSTAAGVFDWPTSVAFDKDGDLWVANHGTSAPNLVEFTPDQLTQSGTPTPHSSIDVSGIYMVGTINFDNNGNLWVSDPGAPPANGSTVGALDELTADQLGSSGATTPHLVVRAQKGADSSFYQPDLAGGFTFDRSGDLWVAFGVGGDPAYGDGVVAEFPASDLSGTGTLIEVPPVELTGTSIGSGRSIFHPVGIAFDNLGNLWVGDTTGSNSGLGHIVEFAPSDIAASGSPAPQVVLQPNLGQRGRYLYNFTEPYCLIWGPEIR